MSILYGFVHSFTGVFVLVRGIWKNESFFTSIKCIIILLFNECNSLFSLPFMSFRQQVQQYRSKSSGKTLDEYCVALLTWISLWTFISGIDIRWMRNCINGNCIQMCRIQVPFCVSEVFVSVVFISFIAIVTAVAGR